MAHAIYQPPSAFKDIIELDAIMPMINHIINEVRPYTVVPDDGLANTIWLTLNTIHAGIEGSLVECGTWKGGASIAMLLAQRYFFGGEIKRNVWMFDSFEGMADPSPEDGDQARNWSDLSRSGTPDAFNQNYCRASVEEVFTALDKFKLSSHADVVPGWFADTLPLCDLEDIAVLRVDCDWYEPCKLVYDTFAKRVSVNGQILIDDYYVWKGCTLATHEFLCYNKLPWPIRSVPNFHGAWITRGRDTW